MIRGSVTPNAEAVGPQKQAVLREVSLSPKLLSPESFERAELVFEGVDHSDSSYEALIYSNNPNANARTGRNPNKGYVGSLTIFGHGRCFGAPGHCDVPSRSLRHGDLREPHPLTPVQKRVVVTKALRQILRSDDAGLTSIKVVPVQRAPAGKKHRKSANTLLKYGKVSLKTY